MPYVEPWYEVYGTELLLGIIVLGVLAAFALEVISPGSLPEPWARAIRAKLCFWRRRDGDRDDDRSAGRSGDGRSDADRDDPQRRSGTDHRAVGPRIPRVGGLGPPVGRPITHVWPDPATDRRGRDPGNPVRTEAPPPASPAPAGGTPTNGRRTPVGRGPTVGQ